MSNYIEPISGFQPTSIRLFDLYEKYKSGEIQPYSVWLQRLKQESKWSAKDWFKARSYLFRLISSGKNSKSIFTVVNIKLLIVRLDEQINHLSPENVKGNIFKKMIDDLEKMQQGGCKFILLDGQNRLEYPIKRFFENDLQFYLTNQITKKNKSIGFVLDDKKYSKESFNYKDLSSDEKSLIEDIEVIFAIGREGEIDEFIDDLIDDNSGESWNDFERAVTSLRTINYLVNTSLSKGKGNEPAFTQVLKRVGKLSGDYHQEKKGYHKIICELIQYDLNGHLRLDYSTILDETKRDKIQTSFNNVKSFFRLLTKDKQFNWSKGTANVFATKEMLRNFFMVIEVLRSGSAGIKLNFDDIKLVKTIYDDFEKFDSEKRDRNENSDEYMDAAGQLVPKPNTWIWAQKDIREEVLNIRKSNITQFVNDHIESWETGHVFKRTDRNEVTPNIRNKVILETDEDYYSIHGQPLNRFVDDIEVDHFDQFGRGGSNDISNLIPTTSESNTARVK